MHLNELGVSIHRQRTTPDYGEWENLQIDSPPSLSRRNSPLCADPKIDLSERIHNMTPS